MNPNSTPGVLEKAESLTTDRHTVNDVKKCLNPFCRVPLSPSPRSRRRYCSDRCKLDHWAILRTAELVALADLSEEQVWEVLREVCEQEAEG